MLYLKSVKRNKRTAVFTFEYESEEQFKELVALALVSGFYNPLRKFTDNDKPIDWEIFKGYRDKFLHLIADVKFYMNIKTSKIEKLD